MATIEAVLTASIEDFKAKMEEARGEMDETEAKGDSMGSKLTSLGQGLALGLGAAIVGVGVAAVDLGLNWQTMTSSLAANAGISIKSATNIGNAFLNIGTSSVFTAQQVMTAYTGVAAQLGATEGHALNAKQAMDVMRASMDLAEASATGLTNATADVAKMMQAYHLPVQQAAMVSNVLYNTSKDTGVGVDSLTQSIARVRTQLGAAAPSIQQTGGLLVDMAAHGETGRQALSALSTAFTGLLAPTAAVTAAQQQAGVSFTNAKGQLLPLDQIIGELTPKIAGMGDAQATAYLKSLGFGAGSAKLLAVIEAGPAALDKYTAAVSKVNSAHDAAEKKASTLQAEFEKLKAGVDDYLTKLGSKLVPKIQEVVKWFSKHKEVAEALGVAILVLVGTAIAAYIVSMATAAAATIAAAAPMLAIIAVAALVAAAFYEIVKHWSTIEGFFKKLWHDVEGVFTDAFNFIKSHLADFIEGAVVVLTGGALLIPVLLFHYWKQVESDVITVWGDIVTFFTGIPGKILGAISGLGGQLLSWAKDAFDAVKTGFVNAWQDVSSWLGGLWSAIKSAIGDLVGDFTQFGKDVINGFLSGLKSVWQTVTGWVSHAAGDIKSAFSTVLGILSPSTVFFEYGVNIVQGLTKGLQQEVPTALATVTTLATQIKTNFANAIGGGILKQYAGPTGPAQLSSSLGGGLIGPSGTINPGQSLQNAQNGPIYLQIDGQTFATVVLPSFQRQAALYQRTVPLPVFGTANIT